MYTAAGVPSPTGCDTHCAMCGVCERFRVCVCVCVCVCVSVCLSVCLRLQRTRTQVHGRTRACPPAHAYQRAFRGRCTRHAVALARVGRRAGLVVGRVLSHQPHVPAPAAAAAAVTAAAAAAAVSAWAPTFAAGP